MIRTLQLAVLALVTLASPVMAQTVDYMHTDALGSVVAVTDSAGSVIERNQYEPYGSDLTGIKDGPGYTGHVSDAATGLSYMQQRYYDPTLGRFLSVDPATPLSGPVAVFNRYSYAGNNPVTATDPDGQRCVVANASSVYCMRRDIYQHFDRKAGNSTRFFGAAARTVEFLANTDMPLAGVFGSVGFGVSGEANSFLHQVSGALYSVNSKTFSEIMSGTLSGKGLDSKLVHMEQTAVQSMLDALSPDQRSRIVESINGSFSAKQLAGIGSASDQSYVRVLNKVENKLGRAIDFGNQLDREAIGNALIKDIRSTGGCSKTGTRISQC